MINIDIRKSVKCQDEVSLFVTFPYDKDIVDIIHKQSAAYWDKDNKSWELSFNSLSGLINDLSKYDVELKCDDGSLLAPRSMEIPADFTYKTQPYAHQIESLKYGIEHDRWLLGDEQGLGKTKQIIDLAVVRKLQRGYKHCLIICGVNGLKWNWVNEIHTHSNENAWILGQKDTGKRITIGSNKDKLADLNRLEALNSYFIITNVETLRDEQIVAKLSELCKNKTIQMIAADEVHKCKNSQSQQGKGFVKLHTETMVAMTGTPLMNQPLDLYIIFKWLGMEGHSLYNFKNYYCEMGGYGGYQVVGYRHLDELQDKLNSIMLRRLKKDVLDLPEKTFVDEFVEMTPKQSQIYKEVSMEVQANIDRIAKSNNPLAEMIRLRQATGFTGILSSVVGESAKMDRMVELVDDAISNGKKTVIFSNWTQITDVVMDRLENYRVAQITGETPDSQRQSIVDEFQKGNIDVLVGTIGAMGTGLTLTAGTVEIFLDEPWNMALKEQAIDRCHRIGQNENITVYTLLTKNTIDERIHEIVCKKGAMADAIVDGHFIMGDKKSFIDYLLS